MLQSLRNKETVSILDKLKQKGMPPAQPVEFDANAKAAMPDEELDAMGQVLRAPGQPGNEPLEVRNRKKKRSMGVAEELASSPELDQGQTY